MKVSSLILIMLLLACVGNSEERNFIERKIADCENSGACRYKSGETISNITKSSKNLLSKVRYLCNKEISIASDSKNEKYRVIHADCNNNGRKYAQITYVDFNGTGNDLMVEECLSRRCTERYMPI